MPPSDHCPDDSCFERAFHDLDGQSFEVAAISVPARQHPHRMPGFEQHPSHGRTDKPGGAGNQAQARGKRHRSDRSPVFNHVYCDHSGKTLHRAHPLSIW